MSDNDGMEGLLKFVGRIDVLEEDLMQLFASINEPKEDRPYLSYGLFKLSILHGRGIRSLVTAQQPAPALALLRPQFEACLRGIWVAQSAGTADAHWVSQVLAEAGDGYTEPHFPKKLGQYVTDLRDAGSSDSADTFDGYLKVMESALHAYTHGGRIIFQGVLDAFEFGRISELLRNSMILSTYAYQSIGHTVGMPTKLENAMMAVLKAHAELLGVQDMFAPDKA